MKFIFISVGKKNDSDIASAITDYTERIERSFKTEWKIISSSDKQKEAESILKSIKSGDFVVALDEKGKELNTTELSEFVEKRMITGDSRVIFIIGGAYGIDETVFERANFVWSLSKLTFPHQLARLIIAESLYRAISVLKKEPYHHV